MSRLADLVWHRLTGLMPGELNQAELGWLVSPHRHLPLLRRRRATLIINRVRLFAFLFAVLTPLWSLVDLAVFPFSLWLGLAVMRFTACGAFTSLLLYYRPNGKLFDAYRAMALLFTIPALFYLVSHLLLETYHLTGLPAAIGAGYAFLPFVLLAGLAIFPLTLLENLVIAGAILVTQGLAGYLRWESLDWPAFAGTFWLLMLIAGVSTLAGISQLAFMIALVRQAIRDPLTGIFSRSSGEEVGELQFNYASRNGGPLSVAFIDLDHFKSINDRFGHEAGDKALTDMTDIVSRNLRNGDALARWGGEEFMLIMPNTDRAQAEVALTRLMKLGFGSRPDGVPITASIGIAERRIDQAGDWKALVEMADRRMYRAKQDGRDRICSRDAVP